MSSTPKTGTLEIINSRADRNGNRYWACRYTDHATGRVAQGTTTGGESNINATRLHLNPKVDGWDGSIIVRATELGIRDFNRTTRDWPHFGCLPQDIAANIRAALDQAEGGEA